MISIFAMTFAFLPSVTKCLSFPTLSFDFLMIAVLPGVIGPVFPFSFDRGSVVA